MIFFLLTLQRLRHGFHRKWTFSWTPRIDCVTRNGFHSFREEGRDEQSTQPQRPHSGGQEVSRSKTPDENEAPKTHPAKIPSENPYPQRREGAHQANDRPKRDPKTDPPSSPNPLPDFFLLPPIPARIQGKPQAERGGT